MKRLLVLSSGCLALVMGFTWLGLNDLSAEIPDRKEVPNWIAALKDPKAGSSRRVEAAKDLGRLGQVRAADAKPAIPTLLNVLAKDKDQTVRRASAEALGMIASEPETVVPALMKILNDDKENLSVRTGAATALGSMQNEARSAVSDLRKIATEFKGKDKPKDQQQLARAAQDALKKINPKKK
jgi:HEAT repeat protein